ncbi:hypothetical protein [Actinomadura coerulea]|uniref:hypothetical protein n=1 Tax=Actinomadura coerulea TaxID=46159 RepID=UPI0034421E2A
MEARETDIDPAAITRLDAREEWAPTTGGVRQRRTVGTAPVLLSEAPAPRDIRRRRAGDPGRRPPGRVRW